MPDLAQDDERAVERLSFYMLKEAYGAVASVLEKLDPTIAQTLFDRIETQIQDALRRIHTEQSEGDASTGIATAIAETLLPILDEVHRHDAERGPVPPVQAPEGLEAIKSATAKLSNLASRHPTLGISAGRP